jgi:mRNA-degrading endonuclease toxin of MazEF toxin-antitoxin module
MSRGEIWVVEARHAYVLIGSDHIANTRSRPPVAWGIPMTAEAQPKKFTEPFVIPPSPTQTGLNFDTWILVARGIRPLRQSQLTTRLGSLTPKATNRLNDALRLLYDL